MSDLRTQIVAEIMKMVNPEPIRIKLDPKPTIDELEANLNSYEPRKLDISGDGNIYELRPAPPLTVGVLADAILKITESALAASRGRERTAGFTERCGHYIKERNLYCEYSPVGAPMCEVKDCPHKAIRAQAKPEAPNATGGGAGSNPPGQASSSYQATGVTEAGKESAS